MDIERVSTVFPVDDLETAVGAWTAILGTDPTFVDGDRWAQFDVGTARIALAGTDRVSEQAGVMIKVRDLDAACVRATAAGFTVSGIERGPHEMRCVVTTPDGSPIVLYSAV